MSQGNSHNTWALVSQGGYLWPIANWEHRYAKPRMQVVSAAASVGGRGGAPDPRLRTRERCCAGRVCPFTLERAVVPWHPAPLSPHFSPPPSLTYRQPQQKNSFQLCSQLNPRRGRGGRGELTTGSGSLCHDENQEEDGQTWERTLVGGVRQHMEVKSGRRRGRAVIGHERKWACADAGAPSQASATCGWHSSW